MGIRVTCPNGHKLNVKSFLAGKRGVCPQCGARFVVPRPDEAVTPQVVPLDGASKAQTSDRPPAASANSLTASQSIIISVAESETAQTADPARPAASLADAPVVTEPIGLPTATKARTSREKRRRNQLAISIVLLVLVIVLAAVFIWVLKRDVSQTPVKKVGATVTRAQTILGTSLK